MTDYERICKQLGTWDEVTTTPVDSALHEVNYLQHTESEYWELRLPNSLDSWKEEDGPVLWWKFPLSEPPYAGTPLDDDFPDYVTHWTRCPQPVPPFGMGD